MGSKLTFSLFFAILKEKFCVISGVFMKKILSLLLCALLALPGCAEKAAPQPTAETVQTQPVETTVPAQTLPKKPPAAPICPLPAPEPVVQLTAEETQMLLKIGMAERGSTGCPECIALVMCTVLNRVKAPGFGNSLKSVIFAPEQFTPVMDGSYDTTRPNENCYDALEMVRYGWDESRGALYYEWCEGESWHSKNLNLLFQHCDIRFYE